jgi:hypothetical protein
MALLIAEVNIVLLSLQEALLGLPTDNKPLWRYDMKSICAGCKLIFTGVSAFDKHRVGEYSGPIFEINPEGQQTRRIIGRTPNLRHCLTVPEIQALGMIQNDRGWWGEPLDEAGRQYFKKRDEQRLAK